MTKTDILGQSIYLLRREVCRIFIIIADFLANVIKLFWVHGIHDVIQSVRNPSRDLLPSVMHKLMILFFFANFSPRGIY